jgi:hypothetical protein
VNKRVRANRAKHYFDLGSGNPGADVVLDLRLPRAHEKPSTAKWWPDGSAKPLLGRSVLSDFASNAIRLTE